MKRARHIHMSEREYKRMMRKRMRALRSAAKAFTHGCAFIPNEAYRRIREALALIEAADEICKPWWRKA